MEKRFLLCTVVAAGSDIVLNLIWIPVYGAKAAAVNTVISYVIFLAGLGPGGTVCSRACFQSTVASGSCRVGCSADPLCY